MKAVIRLKQLTPKKAKVVLVSIENEEVMELITFDLAAGLYDDLIRNYKKDLLVEMTGGVIQKFYQVVSHNEVVITTQNKFDILKAIVPIPLNKSEVISRYMGIVGCSERTGRRHLADAIKLRYIKEINHYQVVSIETGQSGQSGHE